jgi:hypothetical protein
MGLLNLIRRNKPTEEDTVSQDALANTMVYTRNQESAADLEGRQSKGIDIDMIDPQEINKELESLAHFNYTVKVNKLVNVQTPNGIISDVVQVDDGRVGDRPWAIAILGYLNKVWPTIWMSPFEADTTKLRIRTAFHDIRKSMSYDEKKRYSIIWRMARDLCLARCEDMKDGHKGLLVKVKREDLGVHISRGNNGVGDKK